MASVWGDRIKISIFGESHGKAIGVTVCGLPAGETLDMDELKSFLSRRAPGQGAYSTTRMERDIPRVISGLFRGKTTGAPLAALIENSGQRSEDYSAFEKVPRPGHADYTAFKKYGGFADIRGGGHFSGRLTASLCIAGGICKQIAARRGVTIGAHIMSIGGLCDDRFDPVSVSPEDITRPGIQGELALINPRVKKPMLEIIANAARESDSVGGVVESCILGLEAGLGDPMFDGVENKLAQLLFGIPAVKAVEFGGGFALAGMMGSQANDVFVVDKGKIKTMTNNHGGALGGITSGMPIIARVGFKPTPSISKRQQSINLETGDTSYLCIEGRHDPCVVPRAVPCVEAACAIAAMDLMLECRKDS